MSLFVYPPVLTDEQKAERRRLAEQARRIAAIKTGLLISSVVLGLLVVGVDAEDRDVGAAAADHMRARARRRV